MASMLKSEPVQALSGALALGGLGASGAYAASHVYGKVSDAIKSYMSYEQMFEEFPNLKEIPRTTVDKYWGVLMDYAPKLTINPLVAGQFIENMATYGMKGVDYNVAKELINIQNAANAPAAAPGLGMLSGMGMEALKSGMRPGNESETSIASVAAGEN
jgi:hypothetical protein